MDLIDDVSTSDILLVATLPICFTFQFGSILFDFLLIGFAAIHLNGSDQKVYSCHPIGVEQGGLDIQVKKLHFLL